jgi:hypothetical protein
MFNFIMKMVDKAADSVLLAKIETVVLAKYNEMCTEATKCQSACPKASPVSPEALEEELPAGPKVEVKL